MPSLKTLPGGNVLPQMEAWIRTLLRIPEPEELADLPILAVFKRRWHVVDGQQVFLRLSIQLEAEAVRVVTELHDNGVALGPRKLDGPELAQTNDDLRLHALDLIHENRQAPLQGLHRRLRPLGPRQQPLSNRRVVALIHVHPAAQRDVLDQAGRSLEVFRRLVDPVTEGRDRMLRRIVLLGSGGHERFKRSSMANCMALSK